MKRWARQTAILHWWLYCSREGWKNHVQVLCSGPWTTFFWFCFKVNTSGGLMKFVIFYVLKASIKAQDFRGALFWLQRWQSYLIILPCLRCSKPHSYFNIKTRMAKLFAPLCYGPKDIVKKCGPRLRVYKAVWSDLQNCFKWRESRMISCVNH